MPPGVPCPCRGTERSSVAGDQPATGEQHQAPSTDRDVDQHRRPNNQGDTMIKALSIAGVCAAVLLVLLCTGPAYADPPHTLVVDGTPYAHTHTAGPTVHWETPTQHPTTASYEARGQVWQGHGAEHLPCAGGVHWVSNENVLVVSHCLGAGDTTTTVQPTTTAGETTTTAGESTSTSSTSPVTSTTRVQPTTTQAQATTTVQSETTTTFRIATTTPLPSTTGGHLNTTEKICGETGGAENTRCSLPATGTSTTDKIAMGAFLALIVGAAAVVAARR